MTTVPIGAVVITPEQMYADMRETHDLVAKTDGKIDLLHAKFDAALTTLTDHESRIRGTEAAVQPVPSHSAQLEDQEGRIRALEKRVWKAAGAAAVLAGGMGAVAGVIWGG